MLVAVLAFLGMQGCDNGFSPKGGFTPLLVVYGVLRNDVPYQIIRVEQTYDSEDLQPDQPQAQPIIPADCLAAFSHGAYNVHPGSPDYPGVAPEAWAAYEKADGFGATFHVMDEEVDAGAIIDTRQKMGMKVDHRRATPPSIMACCHRGCRSTCSNGHSRSHTSVPYPYRAD